MYLYLYLWELVTSTKTCLPLTNSPLAKSDAEALAQQKHYSALLRVLRICIEFIFHVDQYVFFLRGVHGERIMITG